MQIVSRPYRSRHADGLYPPSLDIGAVQREQHARVIRTAARS